MLFEISFTQGPRSEWDFLRGLQHEWRFAETTRYLRCSSRTMGLDCSQATWDVWRIARRTTDNEISVLEKQKCEVSLGIMKWACLLRVTKDVSSLGLGPRVCLLKTMQKKRYIHGRPKISTLCPSKQEHIHSTTQQTAANRPTCKFGFGLTLLIRDSADLQHSNKATHSCEDYSKYTYVWINSEYTSYGSGT
jgi:hypothetical protein